jgi:hypothetical protein
MKHLITHFLLFAAILSCSLLFHSCTKTPDEPDPVPTPTPCTNCLPPITTEGKGTFGCKVNGNVWLTKGAWGNPATVMRYSDTLLNIYGFNDKDKSTVALYLSPVLDSGFYNFQTAPFTYSSVAYSPSYNQSETFSSSPATVGFLKIIKFQPYTTGIISGTFEFDVYNSEGDTLHITEGRFDLHF